LPQSRETLKEMYADKLTSKAIDCLEGSAASSQGWMTGGGCTEGEDSCRPVLIAKNDDLTSNNDNFDSYIVYVLHYAGDNVYNCKFFLIDSAGAIREGGDKGKYPCGAADRPANAQEVRDMYNSMEVTHSGFLFVKSDTFGCSDGFDMIGFGAVTFTKGESFCTTSGSSSRRLSQAVKATKAVTTTKAVTAMQQMPSSATAEVEEPAHMNALSYSIDPIVGEAVGGGGEPLTVFAGSSGESQKHLQMPRYLQQAVTVVDVDSTTLVTQVKCSAGADSAFSIGVGVGGENINAVHWSLLGNQSTGRAPFSTDPEGWATHKVELLELAATGANTKTINQVFFHVMADATTETELPPSAMASLDLSGAAAAGLVLRTTMDEDIVLGGGFSIQLWAFRKPSTVSSASQVVFSMPWLAQARYEGDDFVFALPDRPGASAQKLTVACEGGDVGKWVHWTVIYDADLRSARVLRYGKLVASAPSVPAPSVAPTGAFAEGADQYLYIGNVHPTKTLDSCNNGDSPNDLRFFTPTSQSECPDLTEIEALPLCSSISNCGIACNAMCVDGSATPTNDIEPAAIVANRRLTPQNSVPANDTVWSAISNCNGRSVYTATCAQPFGGLVTDIRIWERGLECTETAVTDYWETLDGTELGLHSYFRQNPFNHKRCV
jgi:hypothetical protein